MHPCKRTTDLVLEQVDGETLVYDLVTNEAHCLDPAATALWDRLDGARDTDTLAAETGLEPAAVVATLDQLHALGLLEAAPGMTRRDGLRTALRTAAVAAVAVPLVRTITVPEAAAAGSLGQPGQSCSSGVQCASGACMNGLCV